MVIIEMTEGQLAVLIDRLKDRHIASNDDLLQETIELLDRVWEDDSNE